VKSAVFWLVTPCSLVDDYLCLGGIYCLNRQGLGVSQASLFLIAACFFSSDGHLMTLSLPRLQSVDDRIINEYGAFGGMKIGRRNRSTRRKAAADCLHIYSSTLKMEASRCSETSVYFYQTTRWHIFKVILY
jgi:hypothetical protein